VGEESSEGVEIKVGGESGRKIIPPDRKNSKH
jgi:hypothetical protein